jgi:predicted dehydrogenase
MVGGGHGAFIGNVHRMAARLDGAFELVAGAFSSRADVSRESGVALGLSPERCYPDFLAMIAAESARSDGIDAVSIVTPNHMHFAPAKAALEAGIHVICDKPLTATLEEARALALVRPAKGARFLLTHNYSAYPLVRQAREIVRSGELGPIRVVKVEYAQDWLAKPAAPGNRQADWRSDPSRSGLGGCIGDIGTHAYQLACFVTGLRAQAVAAQLTAFVSGRRLDDDAQLLLRFEGGAKGMLWASQVAVGCENSLRLRVYGENAGLEWEQEDPNRMWFCAYGQPRRLLTRAAAPGALPPANTGARLPPGHPEGYLEAFATLYHDFAAAIRGNSDRSDPELPGLVDGLDGMAFIAAAVESSSLDSRWTPLVPAEAT